MPVAGDDPRAEAPMLRDHRPPSIRQDVLRGDGRWLGRFAARRARVEERRGAPRAQGEEPAARGRAGEEYQAHEEQFAGEDEGPDESDERPGDEQEGGLGPSGPLGHCTRTDRMPQSTGRIFCPPLQWWADECRFAVARPLPPWWPCMRCNHELAIQRSTRNLSSSLLLCLTVPLAAS